MLCFRKLSFSASFNTERLLQRPCFVNRYRNLENGWHKSGKKHVFANTKDTKYVSGSVF